MNPSVERLRWLPVSLASASRPSDDCKADYNRLRSCHDWRQQNKGVHHPTLIVLCCETQV